MAILNSGGRQPAPQSGSPADGGAGSLGVTAASARPAVLILATAFPPDAVSGAARPGRFAKYLPQFGYEPIVICQSGPGQVFGSESVRRVPPPTPGRKARLLDGLGRLTQRFLLPYNDGLEWTAHLLAEAEALLARRPIAAVLSTSPPVATHLGALWLKRRHGLPWVADFRDPLWGNPFRSRRWPFPYDAPLERLLFRHANALIANTDQAAEMWRRRHRGLGSKVSVIWNGFDPEDRVEPFPPPPGERRVLAHVGTLYGRRHPGRLLGSLARLIDAGSLSPGQFRVRLVGPLEESWISEHRGAVEALRSRGSLEYDGRTVSPDEARRVGAQADYLLLLDLNEQDASLQVPAKLFEYIRLGRPILAFTGRQSPTERILRDSGVPYRVVPHGADDLEVDRQVRELFDLPTDPARPSPWFEEHFDGRNQTRALAAILDAARGRPAPSSAVKGRSEDC